MHNHDYRAQLHDSLYKDVNVILQLLHSFIVYSMHTVSYKLVCEVSQNGLPPAAYRS